MTYHNDDSRFAAIETRDASASGQFVYGDKNTGVYCRPDCSSSSTPPRASIALFDAAKQADKLGFKPCESCKPDLEVRIENDVIDSTVSVVNASLGLDLPSNLAAMSSSTSQSSTTNSFDSNHHTTTSTTNNNHNGSGAPIAIATTATANVPIYSSTQGLNDYNLFTTSSPNQLFSNVPHQRSFSTVSPIEGLGAGDAQGWRPRRASIASGHIPAASAALAEISRAANGPSVTRKRESRSESTGGGDHARLVDEACRHIAAAAASAAASAAKEASDQQAAANIEPGVRHSNKPLKLQRKKRRGGILGFKELAAKAGLSPWHFHRVFRSVTGLTPKAYGEACWNAVTANPQLPSSMAANNNNNNNNSLPPAGFNTAQQQPPPPPSLHLTQRSDNRFGQLYMSQHQYMESLQNQQRQQAEQRNAAPSTTQPSSDMVTASPLMHSMSVTADHSMPTSHNNSSSLYGPSASSFMGSGVMSSEAATTTSVTDAIIATTLAGSMSPMTQSSSSTSAPTPTTWAELQSSVSTVCGPSLISPAMSMKLDSMVTTGGMSDIFVTTAGDSSSSITMAPPLAEPMEIGSLSTVPTDGNQNSWLVETPSVISGDLMIKDPFFQSLSTGMTTPALMSTAAGEWPQDASSVTATTATN